jgi:transposase
MTPNELQNFLTLSYGELEDLNLAAKSQRQGRVPMHQIQEERLKYLTDEKRIKAVTVDPRIYGAARERSSAAHGLERLLLGPERRFRLRQGDGLRRGN